MIAIQTYEKARQRTLEYLQQARIVLKPREVERTGAADFGLGKFEMTGQQLLTTMNTERICAKGLALFPGQTCTEHHHPPTKASGSGKA